MKSSKNFSNKLIEWYLDNKRDLPWRNTTNPYFIWLSEVILQQTQIKQGLPYYNSFINEFPTVYDLAIADENYVLNLWQGLGYYSRARNLHTTAKYIANELNGVFPDNYTDLIRLRGIGDYTASAMASICFNEPTPVVDGNVYRFLSRCFGVKTPIDSSTAKKEFKELAQNLMDINDPATFNQAIMEFGARQCKPQNPVCYNCPFNSICIALGKDMVKELPVKKNVLKITKRHFNYLVFLSDDQKTIIEQRKGKGIWQKLYQFPLVETIKEATLETLVKEPEFKNLTQNTDYSISVFNGNNIVHKLSHQHLYTKFWIISLHKLPGKGLPFKKIHNYPFPTLINNFIKEFNY
ncbi:MAG: A/G-specific adenine glycosylase [Bacteroidia bacterium]|nr:A/G-specific adenine glycosylase [Bacteroidia bacterium]